MKDEDVFANLFSNSKIAKDVENIKEDEADDQTEVLSKPAKESKVDEAELPKEKIVEESKADLKSEFDLLKKRLEDSKEWGHKKNLAYVNAKKKMTDFLNKLQDEGLIFEEQATEALGFFNAKDDAFIENDKKENTDSPFIELKGKLDKEFSIFKKYAKIDNAEEKYNAFFYFWPMLSEQEQNETLTYLKEEEPSIVIDKIMNTGSKLHDTVISGINKNGGLVPFIESLQEQNVKLQEKINKLQSELDGTTEKVYNRSITSNASNMQKPKKGFEFADLFD